MELRPMANADNLSNSHIFLYRNCSRNPAHSENLYTSKNLRWTNLLILVACATTIGTAVPVGYCIGAINSPAHYIKEWCSETVYQRYNFRMNVRELDVFWGLVVSIFLIGGAAGSLSASWAANKYGRRKCIYTIGVLFTIGALLFMGCRKLNSVEMLILGRFIVGLASGFTTTVLPMYLMELAPLSLKSTLGVFCGMGVTGGVVCGQIFTLNGLFGCAEYWQYGLSFYIILIVMGYLPAIYFPSSPKYLYVIRGDYNKTLRELMRLRGSGAIELINTEISEMSLEKQNRIKSTDIISVMKDPSLLLPLIIVCSFQCGQQLSGINAIFYYSVSTFQKAGLSFENAALANLGAGCLNLATSFFGPLLMQKVDRRPLMMFSTSLCACFLVAITGSLLYIDQVSWLPIASICFIMGYIFFYQLGLGPIPYFIGSGELPSEELFEVAPRPAAMSLGSLSSWSGNFLVGMLFPILSNIWGAYAFLPFAVICILLFLLTKFYLPESRGRNASDIAPLISKGFRSRIK